MVMSHPTTGSPADVLVEEVEEVLLLEGTGHDVILLCERREGGLNTAQQLV